MTQNVIVLNADYTYLNMVHWKRAVILMIKEKAIAVETETETENIFKKFKSEKKEFIVPIILRLTNLVKTIYNKKIIYTKKSVFIRDNKTCQYCGEKNKKLLNIDHIVPKSKGGKTNFENCVTCCKKCNEYKGNKYLEETNLRLKRQPFKPTVAFIIKSKLNKEYIKLISSYLI
jgi:5-methylcytosine-specific restriction endonuclease McrA